MALEAASTTPGTATWATTRCPTRSAGIKELGKRYPWIDLDRVGIWGHSGGGNASADAMFRYPDFFKVGWAESGNHDNRNYENDWAEKYQGLLVKHEDGSSNYDDQANQDQVEQPQGSPDAGARHVDDNVPPSNTLLVVDALIKANKRLRHDRHPQRAACLRLCHAVRHPPPLGLFRALSCRETRRRPTINSRHGRGTEVMPGRWRDARAGIAIDNTGAKGRAFRCMRYCGDSPSWR